MSETTALPSFVKWGEFKSKDADKPDIIEIRILDPKPFMTEYSTNVRVEIKNGENWHEVVLPIKSHTSNNASLLTKWTDLQNKGKLKSGQNCIIETYLGTTKLTDRPIRRFAISLR